MTVEPVYLYTEKFFLSGKFKSLAKIIIGRRILGPGAVFLSLALGLNELGFECRVDQKISGQIGTACVLSGVKTLAWAISQKQKGVIKKIIAGPNLVVAPNEAGGILKSPLIDAVVVPCQWVKDFYISQAPELLQKIFVWAAGVDLPMAVPEKKQWDFLIYNKLGESSRLYAQVSKSLRQHGFRFQSLGYGCFSQDKYFNLLNRSKYLIYLSESESQGLAMFEAWARGVPTLVWERGFWQRGSYRFEGNTASPYLTPECGERFKDAGGLENILPKFLNSNYHTRQYIAENFTNRLAARNYLEVAGGAR